MTKRYKAQFDQVTNAVYMPFGAGETERTEAWVVTDFFLDGGGQWLGFDLKPKEGVDLGGPLSVRFGEGSPAHSFPWNQVNVDIDASGNRVGIEFLFGRDMGIQDRLGRLEVEKVGTQAIP